MMNSKPELLPNKAYPKLGLLHRLTSSSYSARENIGPDVSGNSKDESHTNKLGPHADVSGHMRVGTPELNNSSL